MKIAVITVGKKHDETLVGAIAEYEKRVKGSGHSLEWIFIIPEAIKKDGEISRAISTEGEKIIAHIETGDFVITLDEHGKEKTTVALAETLQSRIQEGYKRMVFIIGGAYGLDKSVLTKANLMLSLSQLTFPHQLVRLILTEQIYRVLSVMGGGKYHHE
ncbi:MAG: 23S rRNA (pseudouridine(1915)-N(3))-methyltransferase RlmH [Candidatus Paceibacterota bacterium]|jgi:23S rRNA (pseudouridine1915-N3)-methyltransferase